MGPGTIYSQQAAAKINEAGLTHKERRFVQRNSSPVKQAFQLGTVLMGMSSASGLVTELDQIEPGSQCMMSSLIGTCGTDPITAV